jgi:hypothetical protein
MTWRRVVWGWKNIGFTSLNHYSTGTRVIYMSIRVSEISRASRDLISRVTRCAGARMPKPWSRRFFCQISKLRALSTPRFLLLSSIAAAIITVIELSRPVFYIEFSSLLHSLTRLLTLPLPLILSLAHPRPSSFHLFRASCF